MTLVSSLTKPMVSALAISVMGGGGATRGPELVTNGDFSNGLTGFTKIGGSTVATVTDGVFSVSYDNGAGGYYQDVSCPVGAEVEVIIRARDASGTVSNLWVVPRGNFGGPNQQQSVSGTSFTDYTFSVLPDSDMIRIYLQAVDSGDTLEVESVSARRVL